jgi:serine O-acetyltransferase
VDVRDFIATHGKSRSARKNLASWRDDFNAESIGDDCQIRQNSTFGVLRTNCYQVPIIEDRVDLGCGVAILGAIRIGHDSIIGANSMVNRDVAPYSIMGGVPARVIKVRSNVALE